MYEITHGHLARCGRPLGDGERVAHCGGHERHKWLLPRVTDLTPGLAVQASGFRNRAIIAACCACASAAITRASSVASLASWIRSPCCEAVCLACSRTA